VRAPAYEASPKRWTERAKTSGYSHCTPTHAHKGRRPRETNLRVRDNPLAVGVAAEVDRTFAVHSL
jgi:hypothetical protein